MTVCFDALTAGHAAVRGGCRKEQLGNRKEGLLNLAKTWPPTNQEQVKPKAGL